MTRSLEEFDLKNTRKLRSGTVIPQLTRKEAEAKDYLTRTMLTQLHLMPVGEPCAFDVAQDGSIIYYFDPLRVTEAPPELWYYPTSKGESLTLESGTVIERMSVKRATSYGYYTKERLAQMNYDVAEEPVAYSKKQDQTLVFFYDKKTAVRRPLMCVKCGKSVRYKRKLCEACFEEDLAVRRVEGDLYRGENYHMHRDRVLFFDLELTGVYDHDEIISISIVNAKGETVMDTLVHPVHNKRWKRTEKIHGITPAMVADAPTLAELTPRIKELFENADRLIAYGVSTDYSHIKYIYETEVERQWLFEKTRCCANEFVRYQHEHYPNLSHAALIDAMECMKIEWDGIPHSSIADTVACMKVWEALFPNYYED